MSTTPFEARMTSRQKTADALERYAAAKADLDQVRESRESSAENVMDAAQAFRNAEAELNAAIQEEVTTIIELNAASQQEVETDA